MAVESKMSNMGYVRFENTYQDLFDCYEHINHDVSESEHRYRKLLVQVCRDILQEFNEEEFNDDE
jgi:hypothetical protein